MDDYKDMLKFEDIIRACIKLQNDPEEGVKQIEEIKKRFIISTYLPLEVKQELIVKAIKNTINQTNNVYIDAIASEIACEIDLLLAYANIDDDIMPDLRMDLVVDLFEMSGLPDYIREYAGKDYERLIKMYDRAMSLSNLKQIIDTLETITPEYVIESARQIKDFREAATPEVLDKIEKILSKDDTVNTILKKSIENIAAEETKQTK